MIEGLEASSAWYACGKESAHAWLVGSPSIYRLEDGIPHVQFTSPKAFAYEGLLCDAKHLWFFDGGSPKLLSDDGLTEQAVPMEWDAAGPRPLVGEYPLLSRAATEQDAWLALYDGRILRFMTDEAFGAYQGPAILGTPPSP